MDTVRATVLAVGLDPPPPFKGGPNANRRRPSARDGARTGGHWATVLGTGVDGVEGAPKTPVVTRTRGASVRHRPLVGFGGIHVVGCTRGTPTAHAASHVARDGGSSHLNRLVASLSRERTNGVAEEKAAASHGFGRTTSPQTMVRRTMFETPRFNRGWVMTNRPRLSRVMDNSRERSRRSVAGRLSFQTPPLCPKAASLFFCVLVS